MIETRLDLQRAKRQSFARGAPDADAAAAGCELTSDAPSPVTAADDLAAMMDADPAKA
jgi:hypothetical protein